MPRPKTPANLKPAQPHPQPPSTTSTRTANATATTISSSKGPTLPVIGTDSTHTMQRAGGAQQPRDTASGRPRAKRQRTGDAATALAAPHDTADPIKAKNTLAPLYEPWFLLPAPMREVLVSTLVSKFPKTGALLSNSEKEKVGGAVIPVVFTKNANVKAGVNRLKWYLSGASVSPQQESGSGDKREEDLRKMLGVGEAVLAVSAQGDGATKMVGIVEMAKRVLGSSTSTREGGADAAGGATIGGDGDEWFVYTILSHREETIRERERKTDGEKGQGGNGAGERGNQEGDEEDAVFQSLAELRKKDAEAERAKKMRKVPVLMVWWSRKRLGGAWEMHEPEVLKIGKKV